ncbi:acyl-CoA thioesterase domain-containing protein [Nocardioides sp. KR10-350]
MSVESPHGGTAAGIVYGDIVDLTRAGEGRYTGVCHGGYVLSRAYGGSVLAHALAAAYDDVPPDRQVHSLHAYFLYAVDASGPAEFATTHVRDGSSYSVRRVDLEQRGREAFMMTASFKRPDRAGGVRRQPRLLDEPPGPEGLHDGFADRGADSPIKHRLAWREVPPEMREAPRHAGPDGALERDGWLRILGDLGDLGAAHACGMAYLTDVTLAPTAFLRFPGGERPEGGSIASLDHAIWFHRPVRADEWLLFRMSSRLEADGRTFARGEVWSAAGELVASTAQEAVFRMPD